jgi:hypothetical protein
MQIVVLYVLRMRNAMRSPGDEMCSNGNGIGAIVTSNHVFPMMVGDLIRMLMLATAEVGEIYKKNCNFSKNICVEKVEITVLSA